MSDIPENLRELVNAQLMDGETIQWIDQPVPYYFSVGSSIAFGFGLYFLFWSIAVISIVVVNNTGPAPAPIELFPIGVIILLIGLFLFSAPLRVRKRTQRTVYALTNHRAIIVQGTFSVFNITSYYPADFGDVFSKQKANGLGNLCFRTEHWGSTLPIRKGFFNIRNVAKVERMLQELKRTKQPEKS